MSTVLSRVAERAYWLGRYLERGDATARLVAVNGSLLMDLPGREALGWQPLIDITGATALFEALYGPDAEASERQVCRFMTTDTRHPGSLVSSLTGVRENARNIRQAMPRVTFEYINELHLFARSALAAASSRLRRAEALEGISRRIQQLEGFLSQNMLHDAHWDLLRLGNYVERADMTTRIIDMRTADLFASHHELAPFEDIQWRSILRASFAMQSYNAAVRGPVVASRALDFLFKDRRLPRSYLRCLQGARRSLLALPRHAEPLKLCDRAIHLIESTDVARLGQAGGEGRGKADEGAGDEAGGGSGTSRALTIFVDRCQRQIAALHDAVARAYFDYDEGA